MSKARQSTQKTATAGGPVLDEVLTKVQHWTPDEAVQCLLSAPEGSSEEILISAAVALCMLNRDGSEPNRTWITSLLDAITVQKHPATEQVLLRLARDGRNTRIRMEATRRLGSVAALQDARALLHEYGRDGFRTVTNYHQDTISPVSIRQAAVESLGKLRNPKSEDVHCLVAIATAEAQSGEESAVFDAVVDALFSISRPADINALVDLAGNCHSHLFRLAVLGVLSKFNASALRPRRQDLVKIFVDSLGGFRRDDSLRDRLTGLAEKITSPDLLRGISERHSGLNLDVESGLIAAAALEHYGKFDDFLLNAYLSLARTQENVHSGSRCIRGLTQCASAGHGHTICTHLMRMHAPGYEHLIRQGLLGEVLNHAKAVVKGVATALTALANDGERARCADLCCEGLIRIPLGIVKDASQFVDLESFRTGRDRYGNGRQQITPLIEVLRATPADADTLSALVGELVAPKLNAGAVALAVVLLKHADELASLFLERLFTMARQVCLTVKEPLRSDFPMMQLEPAILPAHQNWCRENLKGLLMAEGSVNRYVLDFLRRNNMEFIPACQKCISDARTAEDADFVMESMALRNDVDALKAIAAQIGFVSTERKIDSSVRKHALELAFRLMNSVKIDDKVAEYVFGQVHARFQDNTEVRLAAYEFCGKMANPRSIRPLKERVKTDTNPAAKTALAAALDAIRKNLATSPLDLRDPKACVSWLSFVADLADASLLEVVTRFLSPPHSDPQVVVAAIKAIEAMHDERGIAVIDDFIAQTSPGGEMLRAARHTRATLQDRKDVDLLDALAEMFPPESPVLDPAVNYTDILGQARVTRIAAALRKSLDLRGGGHWDECVTKIDGVCDALCRAVFELHPDFLGLESTRGRNLAEKPYGTRLGVSEFKRVFPSVQPILAYIHSMRQDGSAAHLEDNDGAGKPGLGEQETERVFDEFRKVFPEYLAALKRPGDES